jgi:hypothetical protein
LPCTFSSDNTATPDQRVSMYADGTNTVLKLATNLPGEGCFVQMSNPNADIDMRVGVTNTDECFILAKNDIKIVDAAFKSNNLNIRDFRIILDIVDTWSSINNLLGIETTENVSDEKASNLSFDISQKIEKEMQYPGQIKVTVIREMRAVNFAK